jgi:hypothetical protein
LRAPGRLSAAQHGSYPGLQLLQRKRLDEIVVGAQVQAVHPVFQRIARGEHQDRQIAGPARTRRRISKPSMPGSPMSSTTRSNSSVASTVFASDAVAGDLHHVSRLVQVPRQPVAQYFVVLYDQDAHRDGPQHGFVPGSGRRSLS